MGGPAFDAIEAWLAGATDIPKLVTINGDLFTQDTAAEEYRRRTQQ
jgi:simple sugar transport system substrate-binding protein